MTIPVQPDALPASPIPQFPDPFAAARQWLKYLSPQAQARFADLTRQALSTPQAADVTAAARPVTPPAPPPLPPRLGPAQPQAPSLAGYEERQRQADVAEANRRIGAMAQAGPIGRTLLATGKQVGEVVSGLTPHVAGLESVVDPYLRREQELEQRGYIRPGRGLPSETEQTVGGLVSSLPFFEAGAEATGPFTRALAARLSQNIPGRALSGLAQTGAVLGTGAAGQATTAALGQGAPPGEALQRGVEAAGQATFPRTPAAAAFLAAGALAGAIAGAARGIAQHAQTSGAPLTVTSELDGLAREASHLSLMQTRTPAQLARLRTIGGRIQTLAQDLPPSPPLAESAAGPERRSYQGRRIEDELDLLNRAMEHFQTGGPMANREAVEAISRRAEQLRIARDQQVARRPTGEELRRPAPPEGGLPTGVLAELGQHARGEPTAPGPFRAALLRRSGLPREEQGQPLTSPLAAPAPAPPPAAAVPAPTPAPAPMPPLPKGIPLGLQAVLRAGAGAGIGAAVSPEDRLRGAAVGAAVGLAAHRGNIGLTTEEVPPGVEAPQPGARLPMAMHPDIGTFRSRLFTGVENAPFTKGTGAQWLAHLSKGTKQAELQETGIADWLGQRQQQVVSRDDVRAAVLPLMVTEHVFGDPGPARRAQLAAANAAHNQTAGELMAADSRLRAAAQTTEGQHLLRRWQERLEDGESVKDVLPAEAPPELRQLAEQYQAAYQARERAREAVGTLEPQSPQYADYQEPGGKDYTEIVLAAPVPTGGEPWFSPKHYSRIANQVAWTRLTTRDIGGVKGRFEEENQSDPHEMGRKEGYQGTPQEVAAATDAARMAAHARNILNQRQGDEVTSLMTLGPETSAPEDAARPDINVVARAPVMVAGVPVGEFRRFGGQVWEWQGNGAIPNWYTDRTDLGQAFVALQDLFHDRDVWRSRMLRELTGAPEQAIPERPGETTHTLAKRHHTEMAAAADAAQTADQARRDLVSGVPQLPFSDTKAWLALLFRRTLADAVSRGLTRMGWTTGKMQAKRWSKKIQEHIDEVKWVQPSGELAYFRGGNQLDVDPRARTATDQPALQAILGKDIADQLVASADASSDRVGSVTGKNLTVGASFFRLVYDNLKAQVAKEDLKRLGIKGAEPKLTGAETQTEEPGVLTPRHIRTLANETLGPAGSFLRDVYDNLSHGDDDEIDQRDIEEAVDAARVTWFDDAYGRAKDEAARNIPDVEEFRDGAAEYVYDAYGSPTDTALQELKDQLKQESLPLFPGQESEPIAPTVAHLRQLIEDQPRHSEARDILTKIVDQLDEDQPTSWKEIHQLKDEILEEYVTSQAESDREQYEPPEVDEQELMDTADAEVAPTQQRAEELLQDLQDNLPPGGGKAPVWYMDIPPELAAKVKSGEGTYLYGGLPLDPKFLKKVHPAALGAAVGAGIGAATDRKHPLRGALLGGLAGAAAGGFARYLKKAPGEAGAAAVQPVAPEVEGKPPRPLQLVQGGPDVEPPPAFDAEPYVRMGKFPAALQAEVRRAVYNAVQQHQLPERPLTVEPSEARRATSEALIARDVATGHFQMVDRLSQELAKGGLTDAQTQKLWDEIGTHRTKAQQLTSFWVKAGTETARELAARKLLAQVSGDPFTWYVEAQRQLGPKAPLTDEVRSRIQGFIKEGDVVGLHHYIATLPQPGGLLRWMSDFVVSNIISGPAVFLKALGGGLTFSTLEHATDKVAAMGDALFSAVAGAERSTIAWKKGMGRATLRGANQGLQNGLTQLLGKPIRNDPFLKAHPELASEFTVRERHYQNPILELGAKIFTRPIPRLHGVYFNVLHRAAMERAGLELAHVMATNEGLKGADYTSRVKTLLTSPTDEMAVHMLEAGQYASLRDRGLLARMAAQVKQAARTESPLAGLLATEALPITAVPANALARVLEYAGGGLLTGAADLTRLVSEGLAEATVGPARGFKGRELSRLETRARMFKRLARGTVGPGGLVVLGYQLAKHGLMTGAYPDDPAEKRSWDIQRKTAYSLKVKGRWRNVASIIPVGPVVAIGAGIYDIFHRTYTGKGELATKGAKVAQAALLPGRMIAEQPFLQQPKEIAATLSGEGSSASKIAAGMAGSLIPYSGALRQLSRGMDRYRRQATGPLQQVQATIPGLSQQLPPQMDPFGHRIEQATGLEGVLDPTRPQADLSTDPIRAELGRVRWGPTKLRLLPSEEPRAFVQRQAVWGAQLRNVLVQVVNSDEYQALRAAELAGQHAGGNVGAYQAEVARQQEVELLRRVESAVRSAQMRALKAEAR